MHPIHLELVTPERILLDSDVDEVVVPGAYGQFGVLPGHIDFFTRVIPGEFRCQIDGRTELFTVSSGFAEVCADHVTVLVDSGETIEMIDVDRARRALERAEHRLQEDPEASHIDHRRAELALQRAVIRLQAASGRPPH